MAKKEVKLDTHQEAKMLLWLERYAKGIIRGEGRGLLYEIYSWFGDGRDTSTCSCLDSDTWKKVKNFVDGWSWSEEVRKTPKFAQVLPTLAILEEPEEQSTQPVTVDLKKVAQKLKRKKK